MDELKPVSNKSHNWLGLGATLVDCLDNLWIMGMKDEFYEARDWVAQHLHFDRASGISRDPISHTPHSPHPYRWRSTSTSTARRYADAARNSAQLGAIRRNSAQFGAIL